MMDAQITRSYIGEEFGWDHLSDVDLDLLRNNRASMMNVLANPTQFPKADLVACNRKVVEIDAFMAQYGPLLVQFA